MAAPGAERPSAPSFEHTSRSTIMGARLQRRRLLGRPPRPILSTQSTSLRWTWAPDEPLLIDNFADVAPEPSDYIGMKQGFLDAAKTKAPSSTCPSRAARRPIWSRSWLRSSKKFGAG